MSDKTQIYDIRQGERREYQILKYSSNLPKFVVQYRNPDSWFSTWYDMMTQGLYFNYALTFSTCHDAQCCITSDVLERQAQAKGWIPVACPHDGASNH